MQHGGQLMNEYYKKVDRSMMDWGFTIPNEHVKSFVAGHHLKKGTSRMVNIVFNGKHFKVRFCHVNQKTAGTSVYQLRWDNVKDILKEIRSTFIYSYVVLKSQKELFDISKKNGRTKFRTNLEGGMQEVLTASPKDAKTIIFKPFIQIKNEWNTLFERLAEENVFGWLFDKKKNYLIARSTPWYDVKDFNKHKGANNVIYFLANTQQCLLYIGEAEILGNRVKPGRKHQKMPGNWDRFRYDIIKNDYSNIRKRIEDHTIRAFASILNNDTKYDTLGISKYRIVNSNWKKL